VVTWSCRVQRLTGAGELVGCGQVGRTLRLAAAMRIVEFALTCSMLMDEYAWLRSEILGTGLTLAFEALPS
jgi:hypothetical protein